MFGIGWWTNRKSVHARLDLVLRRMEIMMSKIDDLTAKLEANEDAEDAVIDLLNDLVQELKDAKGDDVKIDALIAKVETSTGKLAAAVVAGTDAEPPAEPA